MSVNHGHVLCPVDQYNAITHFLALNLSAFLSAFLWKAPLILSLPFQVSACPSLAVHDYKRALIGLKILRQLMGPCV